MTPEQFEHARSRTQTTRGRSQLVQGHSAYDLAQFVGQLRRMGNNREYVIQLCQLALAEHPGHEPFMNVHIASLVDIGQTRNASRAALRYVHAGRTPFFMRTMARLFSASGLPESAVRIFQRSETGAVMTVEEARALALTLRQISSNGANSGHRPTSGAWYFENGIDLEDDQPDAVLRDTSVGSTQASVQPLKGRPLESRSLPTVTIHAATSRQQIDRATNYLKNCLSQYWKKVKRGQTWIYVVERDGKPIEAIEVHPTSRKVLQWKGIKNCAADPTAKAALTRELITAGVLDESSLPG